MANLEKCAHGNHAFKEIMFVNPGEYEDMQVVRWCPDCGAIRVDTDSAMKTNPGTIMPLTLPEIAKSGLMLAIDPDKCAQKELHIWTFVNHELGNRLLLTYDETLGAIMSEQSIVHTVIPQFCSSEYIDSGYKLFVHTLDRNKIEVKAGMETQSDRELTIDQDWTKLLLANEFGPVTLN